MPSQNRKTIICLLRLLGILSLASFVSQAQSCADVTLNPFESYTVQVMNTFSTLSANVVGHGTRTTIVDSNGNVICQETVITSLTISPASPSLRVIEPRASVMPTPPLA